MKSLQLQTIYIELIKMKYEIFRKNTSKIQLPSLMNIILIHILLFPTNIKLQHYNNHTLENCSTDLTFISHKTTIFNSYSA